MATIKLTGFNTATARSTTGATTDTVVTDGSLTIGDADTDTIIVNAEFDSDLIPDDTSTYDLGSDTKRWDNGHFGNLYVDGYIYRNATDNNTYIRLQDDDINIQCGGKSMIKMSEQPSSQDIVTINNATSGVDFRVKGDDDNNLLRCDASADKVGIGTSVPTTKLDINDESLRLRATKTPSSASDTGDVGTICWDTDYIYVCVADNTWKRAALTTW